MLSKFLSGSFRIAFVLSTLVCLIAITSQSLKRPVSQLTVKNPVFSFGKPGIQLSSRTRNSPTDTTTTISFSYSFTNPGDTITHTGSTREFTMNEQDSFNTEMNKIFPAGMLEVPKNSDPVAIENYTIEKFRIMPSNNWQKAAFALYDVIRFGCPALIFLCLSRLFNNFSKKDYFTLSNVSLLRKIGWLLLIPQLLKLAAYWIFQLNFKPNPNNISNVRPLSLFEVYADLNWAFICIALSCIVLSYIFKDAFILKEDHEFFG